MGSISTTAPVTLDAGRRPVTFALCSTLGLP